MIKSPNKLEDTIDIEFRKIALGSPDDLNNTELDLYEIMQAQSNSKREYTAERTARKTFKIMNDSAGVVSSSFHEEQASALNTDREEKLRHQQNLDEL